MTATHDDGTRLSRRAFLGTEAGAGAAAPGAIGFPAIVTAQAETLRLGHLTPRPGFLGQLGDYGFKASAMAVEEANAGAACTAARSS